MLEFFKVTRPAPPDAQPPCLSNTPACQGTSWHLWPVCAYHGVNIWLQGFAVSPDDLPDIIFGSIGRTVWRDIGATAVCFRMVCSHHRDLD